MEYYLGEEVLCPGRSGASGSKRKKASNALPRRFIRCAYEKNSSVVEIFGAVTFTDTCFYDARIHAALNGDRDRMHLWNEREIRQLDMPSYLSM